MVMDVAHMYSILIGSEACHADHGSSTVRSTRIQRQRSLLTFSPHLAQQPTGHSPHSSLVPLTLLNSSLVPISLAAATNSTRSQRPPAGIDGAHHTNVTPTLRSSLLSGEIRHARPPAAKRGRLPSLGLCSPMDLAPAGDEGRQIRDMGGSSRTIREQRAAPCSRRSGTSAALVRVSCANQSPP